MLFLCHMKYCFLQILTDLAVACLACPIDVVGMAEQDGHQAHEEAPVSSDRSDPHEGKHET